MSLTEGVFDHSKNRYRLDKQSAWPTEIFKCLCNVPRHVSRDQLAQTLNDFLGIAHLEDGVELHLVWRKCSQQNMCITDSIALEDGVQFNQDHK